MLYRLFSMIALASAVGLAGCAATVKQSANGTAATAIRPDSANIGATTVVLTAPPEVQANDDWRSFVEEWQSAVSDAATELETSASLAASESALGAGSTMLVRVKVNGFRYVSTIKRVMLGVVVGNANMDIDVEYVQLPSGQVVGKKKINTTSSAWEGILSAVSPRQIAAVSKILLQDAQVGGSAK